MPFHIAIDGPVASGKGTIARLVAERLHLLYIDTGAMYRMLGLAALRAKISLEDENALVEVLSRMRMEIRDPLETEKDGRLSTFLLDGEDVSWKIRTEEMSSASSQVAVFPKVRAEMVRRQQALAAHQNVIMEGRDITFRVLPNAQMKIYLTADLAKRAERRHVDLLRRGVDVTPTQVFEEMKVRDARDSGRMADPLQVGQDVWVLDTTNLSIDDVVDHIVQKANERRAES
jgi:cytidylate kinase